MKNESINMLFEIIIRQYLGDKAEHIAGLRGNDKLERKYLKKCVHIIRKRIDTLDTTTRHKEMMLLDLEHIATILKGKNYINQELILELFSLISRLLGYDYCLGTPYHNLLYHQYRNQHFFSAINGGIEWLDYYNKEKNIIKYRKDIYHYLRKQQLSDYYIAFVMNTSEYTIKKLKNNL